MQIIAWPENTNKDTHSFNQGVYVMDPYQMALNYCKERFPHAVHVVYRHTDGTLVEFRYSDMKYLGPCPYDDFVDVPDIPPELAAAVTDR